MNLFITLKLLLKTTVNIWLDQVSRLKIKLSRYLFHFLKVYLLAEKKVVADKPSSTSGANYSSKNFFNDKKDEDGPEKKRRKILNWTFGLFLIGIVFLIGYFIFFYSPYNIINVTTVSSSSSSITLNYRSGSQERQVNLNLSRVTRAVQVSEDAVLVTDGSGTITFRVRYVSFLQSPTSTAAASQVLVQTALQTTTQATASTTVKPPITWYRIGASWINGNDGCVHTSATTSSSSSSNVSFAKFLGEAVSNAAPASRSPFVTFLINLVTPALFTFLIFFLLWKFSARSGEQESIFSIGKSQAKIAKTNVLFTDVAGIEEEKAELFEIIDYLKNVEKYAAMGARIPKGVILYGPPGTGKTLLAKAVSGEANVPFFQVNGASFDDMLVGVGAKRVRNLFEKARKVAPCIIFIDEIDSVGAKRGRNDINGAGGGIAEQTINELLGQMDGFNTKTGIVVIAATNRLDVLDDALLRPGRFDRHIQVSLPDIKERTKILKIHARNKNVSKTVDLEDIARRTPGFSGAQLENVLNEATLLAVRHNKTVIGVSEIDEAIDRVVAGPSKTSRIITVEEKRQIACHEAGHAIVGLYSKGGDVIEKITIIPRGKAAGYTISVPSIQEMQIQRKSDLLGMVRTTLAGRAAEEIVYGSEMVGTGASNDFYKVTNVVRSMVMQLGMSSLGMTQFEPSEGQQNPYKKLYSDKTADQIDHEVDRIINEQYKLAKEIIIKNRLEFELIVESLMILETIIRKQIDYIHEHKKFPPEVILKKKKLQEDAKTESKTVIPLGFNNSPKPAAEAKKFEEKKK